MSLERIRSPSQREDFKELLNTYSNYIVIVKCYANWCKPCKNIADFVESEFNKLQTNNKILIYLDIDACKDVSSFLKIRALPTLISYKDGMKNQIIQSSNIDDIKYFFSQNI